MPVPAQLCHHWLLEGSFILCSTELDGFPILYASPGFADLFEIQPRSCTNTKCGALVGPEAILSSYPSLAPAFEKMCDLSDEEITKALNFLQAQSLQEVMEMKNMGTGFLVTVNRGFPINRIRVWF